MTIDRPLVSVIIPAYNHEKFIGAAIDSVLQQTMDDLELIVIDDGSTDQTGTIIRQYSDSRIACYHQENRDAYNTINRGLGLAKGDYIAILNSDDLFTSNRLECLLDYRQKSGAECIITDVIPISDEGEEYIDPEFGWNQWHRKNRNFYLQCKDIYIAFLKGNFMVTTSNLFMTAEAVKKTGDFCSLRYLHDYDYIFRLMLACPGKVHYLFDEKLIYYRIHPGNTLGEAAIIGREQDRELIRKYMLEGVNPNERQLVGAGSERLVELERELNEVKDTMALKSPPGVKAAAKIFLESIKIRINKKLR
ncbi:MAG: glycosyltransferase [Deltaproteobacteria bacterium]|nr:glycosyltransferase [Deltaproteobacteria bacterium]MBW2659015.1 glycosyltransferase [Deltaproteobacteria bacterium]